MEERNRGVTTFRHEKNPFAKKFVVLAGAGGFAGAVCGQMLMWFAHLPQRAALATIAIGAIVALALQWQRWPRYVCSDAACGAAVSEAMTTCPGCGATLGEVVSDVELERKRADSMDVEAGTRAFEDCPDCAPEEPCEKRGGEPC